MAGAAKRRELRFESGHFRAQNELAMIEDARNRSVDGRSKPAALRGDVDKRDRWQVCAQIHESVGVSTTRQATTARGPLRCAGAIAGERVARQRVAISRLATASSPVTAGAAPERTARTNASNSERSGSAWPTDRCRMEKLPTRWKPQNSAHFRGKRTAGQTCPP